MRKLILIAVAGYLWKKFAAGSRGGVSSTAPVAATSEQPRSWS